MSVPRLRFIHATDMMLAAPLCGVGDVADEDRDLVLRATLIAFERIITACVDHDVDFLLLSGNTFVAESLPVCAIAALRDGFQTLSEYDIPVFVVSGPCDPPSAWEDLPTLPETVVHLQLDEGASVEVTRDGLSIAEIRLLGTHLPAARTLTLRNRLTAAEESPLPVSRLFTIGVVPATSRRRRTHRENPAGDILRSDMLPKEPHLRDTNPDLRDRLDAVDCDYFAIGTQPDDARVTSHHDEPVGPQTLSPHESGPHGCMLVVVDAHGSIQHHRLPTACVRFETAELSINSQTSQDELMALIKTRLAQVQAETGEELAAFTWKIRGSGSLFDSLAERAFQNDVAELCELEAPPPPGLRRTHRFALQPAPELNRWVADGESPEATFLTTLQTCAPTLEAVREMARAESAHAAERWAAEVLSQLAQTDEAAVVAHAQAMAIGWLSAVQKSGSRS